MLILRQHQIIRLVFSKNVIAILRLTHPLNGCQNDVEITIVCSEDTNANRYSQDKVLQSLLAGIHSVLEYLPVEDTTQRISSHQPHFVDDKTKALQTIVLLI